MARSASRLVVQERASLSSRLLQLALPLVLIAIVAAIAYMLGVSQGELSPSLTPVPLTARAQPTASAISEQPAAIQAVQPVSSDADIARIEAAFASERTSMQNEIKRLRADVLVQIEQRDKLAVTLNQLDHQLLIDKTAYKELSSALEESSREISRLREEVDFYRNIVSPNETDKGLQISGFRLLPNIEPGEWSLALILVQTFNHDSDIEGELSIEVEGRQGSVQKIVGARSLGADFDSETRFKYYHRVRTQVSVPDDFAPIRVGVIFKPLGKNFPVLSQWYAWPTEKAG